MYNVYIYIYIYIHMYIYTQFHTCICPSNIIMFGSRPKNAWVLGFTPWDSPGPRGMADGAGLAASDAKGEDPGGILYDASIWRSYP